MNWLLAMAALCVINPWGTDVFVLPKVAWAIIALSFDEAYPYSELDNPLFVVIIALCLFTIISQDIINSLIGYEMQAFSGLVQMIVCVMAFEASNLRKQKLSEIILTCSIPMIMWACFQGIMDNTPWSGRAFSTQGGPVFLSMILGMIAPMVFQAEKENQRWALAYICLWSAALYSAGSRIGWLMAGVGIWFL